MNVNLNDLFISRENQEKLDYIFIDEAGQLSLADLIVIGSTAKNIVLIGDQNQLGQDVQLQFEPTLQLPKIPHHQYPPHTRVHA